MNDRERLEQIHKDWLDGFYLENEIPISDFRLLLERLDALGTERDALLRALVPFAEGSFNDADIDRAQVLTDGYCGTVYGEPDVAGGAEGARNADSA